MRKITIKKKTGMTGEICYKEDKGSWKEFHKDDKEKQAKFSKVLLIKHPSGEHIKSKSILEFSEYSYKVVVLSQNYGKEQILRITPIDVDPADTVTIEDDDI